MKACCCSVKDLLSVSFKASGFKFGELIFWVGGVVSVLLILGVGAVSV